MLAEGQASAGRANICCQTGAGAGTPGPTSDATTGDTAIKRPATSKAASETIRFSAPRLNDMALDTPRRQLWPRARYPA